jgi:hypothetical protein
MALPIDLPSIRPTRSFRAARGLLLITGENSSGSVAAFEIIVPGAQRLSAPAHSHDHYEETICGIE